MRPDLTSTSPCIACPPQRLFKDGKEFIRNVIETSDSHGNTLISEAAAGGNSTTVNLLLKAGGERYLLPEVLGASSDSPRPPPPAANPNVQGEFKRTALWRAAFLGKEEVILDLLRGGADPRIPNEGGESPEHVAASERIKELLRSVLLV